jgi:hypothetical protein
MLNCQLNPAINKKLKKFSKKVSVFTSYTKFDIVCQNHWKQIWQSSPRRREGQLKCELSKLEHWRGPGGYKKKLWASRR